MENHIRLKWTSHQGTVLSVFDALLSTESLVDVTLACEGQYIRAHKMILSACSPYFQELINVDVNKHPIFFLKDVKYNELKALIHYMYRGEVNIAHEDLQSLLSVAQALKIRGLAEVETDKNSISSDTIILPDIGTNRVVKPPPPSIVPVPPPPLTIPVPTEEYAQEYTLISQNMSSSATASIPMATVPTSGPPAPKRSRVQTQLTTTSQTARVQMKHSQILDPLGGIESASSIPAAQVLDPFQTTPLPSTSSSHHESSGQSQDVNYGHTGMVQDTEVFGYAPKLEATGAIVIDLEDEEENSRSHSGFSDSWLLDDGGDNSGVADDGEMAGGSDYGESGGGGAEGGKVLPKTVKGQQKETVKGQGQFQCLNAHCTRAYKHRQSLILHLRYECNRSPRFSCDKCNYKSHRRGTLKNHLKKIHKEFQ